MRSSNLEKSWIEKCEKSREDILKNTQSDCEKKYNPEHDKKWLKEVKQFYQYALTILSESVKDLDSNEMEQAYLWAKRIVYSILSEYYSERTGGIFETLEVVPRVMTEITYTKPSKLTKPLSKREAQRESSFLIDPKVDSKRFLDKSELIGKSTLEIADLDIRDDNPMWYSKNEMSKIQNKNELWSRLENWGDNSVTAALKVKNKALPQNYSYQMAKNNNFQFVTAFDKGGTSPKVKGKDPLDVTWKVKFGSEVQTEPVANRLYVMLGGKYNDLIYSFNSKNPLTLILAKSENPTVNDSLASSLKDKKLVNNKQLQSLCSNMTSAEILKVCFYTSHFRFDIAPFILSEGIITQDNIETVLKNYPDISLDTYKKSDLIGRYYVKIKEASVELNENSIMLRGGPTAGSDVGAKSDRVYRSLLLFNVWIRNLDCRDSNNKALILNNFSGKEKSYIETMHDLGTALGGNLRTGRINNLRTKSFMFHFPESSKILISQTFLYRPHSWEYITHADALWMARKIANISEVEMRFAAAASNWPDFVQESLVYKLMKRRNRIAHIYNIEPMLDKVEVAAPNISISLKSKNERENVAKKYGVELAQIEEKMREFNLLDNDGTSHFEDKVVEDGELVHCEKSLLIYLLERHHYPSGLENRLNRFMDKKPLTCGRLKL
ncbi:MAG: hypothetical protein U0T83_02700 [Bacteriovoracaceae bacterium]